MGSKKLKFTLGLVLGKIHGTMFLFVCLLTHAKCIWLGGGGVILVGGGRDTWPLFCIIELVWSFLPKRQWGPKTAICPWDWSWALGPVSWVLSPSKPPGKTFTTWYLWSSMFTLDFLLFRANSTQINTIWHGDLAYKTTRCMNWLRGKS